MKLVITIDDNIYDDYLKQGATLPKYGTAIGSLYEALWNGTPLPENHGRLIDADWVKNTLDIYVINEYNGQFIRRSDIDTIPTIIEGSDSK